MQNKSRMQIAARMLRPAIYLRLHCSSLKQAVADFYIHRADCQKWSIGRRRSIDYRTLYTAGVAYIEHGWMRCIGIPVILVVANESRHSLPA